MKNPTGAYTNTNQNVNRVYLNEFAQRLRNIADDDYIDARTLYRNERYRGFIYHASQAVEKYLKTILLFLEIKAPDKHYLVKLYTTIKKNSVFELKPDSISFIKELEGMGQAVRYDATPYSYDLDLIHYLDFFVRDVRPYCKSRFVPPNILQAGKASAHLNLKSGHEYNSKNIIFNGHLEQIIKSRKTNNFKSNLTWNNLYFYNKNKPKKIYVFNGNRSMNLAPISSRKRHAKRIFEYVKTYYKFPANIVRYYLE